MLLFAHRGGRGFGPTNTLRGFRRALAAGFTALESDVWLTADGVPVLTHGERWLGQPVAGQRRQRLPRWVPSLAELYAVCGPSVAISLDVKDRRVVQPVLDLARAVEAAPRLLLVSGSVELLSRWRLLGSDFRLAHSVDELPPTPAAVRAHARRLADAGVDVLNARHRGWSRAAVDTCHEVGLSAYAWTLRSPWSLRRVVALGCDGAYVEWHSLLAHAGRAVTDAGRGW
jgi:glycerophosphoryl diester phosphodiesterase